MFNWFSRLFSTTDRRSRKTHPDQVAALESRQLLSSNRAPVIPAGQVFHTPEDKSDSTLIGRVLATDADGNSIQDFRVDSYSYGQLTIDSSGQLSSNWGFDYETDLTPGVWVSAYDGIAWSQSTYVQIVVDNVNEPPQMTSGPVGNFKGAAGKNDLIVATSVAMGQKLSTIVVYDPDANDRTLQLGVTGKLSNAVALQWERSEGAYSWYKVVVTRPDLLKKGASTRLTFTFKDSAGQVASQTVDLVIANNLQTIITPENPTIRKKIGQLPSNFRKARTSYYIVGGARSAAQGGMIAIGANGDIIARPTETAPQPGPLAISDVIYPWYQTFDFESTQHRAWFGYQGTQVHEATTSQVNAPWGEVLVAALNQSTGQVQYIVVNIQLSDVDETPTLYEQSIEIGRDGTGGLVWFNDPDRFNGYFILTNSQNSPSIISTNGTTTSTSGPYEMRIVAGDDQGIFSFVPTVFWGSSMQMKIAKPQLLAGRTSFTLKVQLLEKGQVASEATVRVQIRDHVDTLIAID